MRRGRTLLRVLFGLVGVAFLVLAVRKSLDRAEGLTFPPPVTLLAVLGVLLAGLVAAGLGWASLFPGTRERRVLFRSYFEAQLGKYVPGGVWQPVAQVGFSSTPGGGAASASAAFVAYSVAQLVAGLALGSLTALFAADLDPFLRVLSGAGLLSVLLLRTGWLRALARLLERILSLPLAERDLPSRGTVGRCALWAAASLALSGLAFALLAKHFGVDTGVARTVFAFSLAWAVGYAALPFPAGLGVREGALILLLGSDPATVIAASLAHRILGMIAEGGMLAAVEAGIRRR